MGLFDDLKRQAENFIKSSTGTAANSVANAAKSAVGGAAKQKTVTLSKLPLDADEMRGMPEFSLSDPYAVAAFAVAARAVAKLEQLWEVMVPTERYALIHNIVSRIVVFKDRLKVEFNRDGMVKLLQEAGLEAAHE